MLRKTKKVSRRPLVTLMGTTSGFQIFNLVASATLKKSFCAMTSNITSQKPLFRDLYALFGPKVDTYSQFVELTVDPNEYKDKDIRLYIMQVADTLECGGYELISYSETKLSEGISMSFAFRAPE